MPLKKMALIVVVVLAHLAAAEREHKVHGIVLYPDRHSWCQTTPIKQVVASPGYEPATIDNNVCVGACYSYSIPRTQPAEPGELIGPYCDSCQPSETKCFHVTLHAVDKNVEGPPTLQKRVQIITNCSCMSCENKQKNDCEASERITSELPVDLFTLLMKGGGQNKSDPEQQANSDETPEFLHLTDDIFNGTRLGFAAQKLNATNQTNEQRLKTVINLFKSIQNVGDDSNFDYDKKQLKELLEIIENSDEDDLSDLSQKNLMDFVNFVNVHNSENMQIDLSRLKEVLMGLRKDHALADRHRSFGLGLGERNNADINRDVEDLTKKYGLPKSFGIEGSRVGGGAKGSHIGMGMNAIVDDGDGGKQKQRHHHHHHVGEEQNIAGNTGHLIVGPHGSLALKIEEKLQLDADLVKPNHEGLVLTYENHPKQKTTKNDETP